jgi:cytochrome c-type biogenesis protein CcmE
MKKTISIILTVLVVIGGLSYLMLSSFDDNVVYYKTVDELLDDASRFHGRSVRINGVLVPGSVQQKPGTNQYRFQLTKRGKNLDIEYSGILPDSMREGSELIVQGVLNQQATFFAASEILTKCPSKHEARAQALN